MVEELSEVDWLAFFLLQGDFLRKVSEEYVGRKYETKKGLNRLLNGLGIGNKKLRLHCLEAGLIGFISETILKAGQVLLSDRAGQFAIFNSPYAKNHLVGEKMKARYEDSDEGQLLVSWSRSYLK